MRSYELGMLNDEWASGLWLLAFGSYINVESSSFG
jgi:hypothetical protein